ncbi:MAG: magnesium and cobalt transport protein CorA [Candidatus Azobacteroides sp.]|nr:magnesium and cobalt transport protein CorA [Candidatus Azobacteroides sp.]
MYLKDIPVKKASHTKKQHIINHLFSEEYHYDGDYEVETKVLLTQYNQDILEFKHLPNDTPSFRECIRGDCMNWFQVTGLTDTKTILRLLEEFGFYKVDAKPVLTPCHAAKIDDFGNRVIIVMRPSFFEKKNVISSEHICTLSKENIVITFRERGKVSLDNVMRALRLNVMNIREPNRGMLVAFVLNALLSVMIGTAIEVEEMLEKLDMLLVEAEPGDVNAGEKILQCAHANLQLQKNSIPLKSEFNKLLQTSLVKNNNILEPIYNELYNQLDFILLTSQNSKELLASMRDLYVSNNDLKTNAIVKRLTIVSTLFIPLTFLVGVWGMNFEIMSETKWQYGYLFAWGILISALVLTWFYMKRHKWF